MPSYFLHSAQGLSSEQNNICSSRGPSVKVADIEKKKPLLHTELAIVDLNTLSRFRSDVL